jgi:4-hydroxythreonine-4-phosphate dehydrogenase
VTKVLRTNTPRFPVVVIGSEVYYRNPALTSIRRISDIRENGIYYLRIDPERLHPEPSFAFVREAAALAGKKEIAALVTAPISKEKWLKAGIPFRGHTKFLADRAGRRQHAMFFWSPGLKVALFTTHIPLQEVFPRITRPAVGRFLRFLDRELQRLFARRFDFLISGLNPHAGEHGYLGHEESDVIAPAIERVKARMSISGPYPPDVVFAKALETKDAVVVTWYHDQGLIPFKLLTRRSGVNLTLGLPYIRTSPDHGTAFDISGRGIADPSSMTAALRLAETLLDR